MYVQLQRQETSSTGSSSENGSPTFEWSLQGEHGHGSSGSSSGSSGGSSGGSQEGSDNDEGTVMSDEGGDSEDNDLSENDHHSSRTNVFELHPHPFSFRSFPHYSRPSSKAVGDLTRTISTTFLDEYDLLDDDGVGGSGSCGDSGGGALSVDDPSLMLHSDEVPASDSATATATASVPIAPTATAAGEDDWRDLFKLLCCEEEALATHQGGLAQTQAQAQTQTQSHPGAGAMTAHRYPSTSSLAYLFD